MPNGYEALRTSAAWLDLSARGRIEVTGEDRARLLHSMTTNHIQQMTPGAECYAFFLNAQGQIQADGNILCREDRFLLDTEPETRERILKHLDKYIVIDDVTLSDVTDQTACLSVEGPAAERLLSDLKEGATILRISSTGAPGFRLIVPVTAKAEWIARLESAGAVAATPDEARTVRLEHGKPRYGDDIFETTLPQETRQMHAVHFSKGCYLGQEIVERIRSRGHVNRLLVKLEIEGADSLPSGAKVEADAAPVGEITSSAFSPASGKTVALAYVRAQFAEPGTRLTINGRSAVTSSMEYQGSASLQPATGLQP